MIKKILTIILIMVIRWAVETAEYGGNILGIEFMVNKKWMLEGNQNGQIWPGFIVEREL